LRFDVANCAKFPVQAFYQHKAFAASLLKALESVLDSWPAGRDVIAVVDAIVLSIFYRGSMVSQLHTMLTLSSIDCSSSGEMKFEM
jgi:hypothetical protein